MSQQEVVVGGWWCKKNLRQCPMIHGYFVGLCFHLGLGLSSSIFQLAALWFSSGTIALGGFIIGCLKIVAAAKLH